MAEEYQYVADVGELAKVERATWDAYRLARLAELMELYPDKGWALDMQLIDHDPDGTPAKVATTTRLVEPITDPSLPGGLIAIDSHMSAQAGKTAEVQIGDKPSERVTITLKPSAREALSAEWRSVLAKREADPRQVKVADTPKGKPQRGKATPGS